VARKWSSILLECCVAAVVIALLVLYAFTIRRAATTPPKHKRMPRPAAVHWDGLHPANKQNGDDSMHGIRFYRSTVEVHGDDEPIFVHGTLDDSRSDFDFLFSCLYDSWNDDQYVDHVCPCHSWSDQECIVSNLSSILGARCRTDRVDAIYWRNAFAWVGDAAIMPARVLRRFGKYVSDDWNHLVLFHGESLPARRMVNVNSSLSRPSLRQGRTRAFEECEAAHTVLHNWDGVYWEIFTKRRDHIDTLLTTHKGDNRLHIFKVDFYHDYPNPRDAPLEPA
jgi:hypothetical protein